MNIHIKAIKEMTVEQVKDITDKFGEPVCVPDRYKNRKFFKVLRVKK